jgi:hypothetical protein
MSNGAHSGWSTANASLVAANTVAGVTSASASGMALSGIDAWGAYRSAATGAYPNANPFTLSANTMVTFSTNVALEAQTSIGYNLDADQGESANAHAFLFVDAFTHDGQEHMVSDERDATATFNVRDNGSTEGVRSSWNGLMSLSFSNDTAFDAKGVMQGQVQTSPLTPKASCRARSRPKAGQRP